MVPDLLFLACDDALDELTWYGLVGVASGPTDGTAVLEQNPPPYWEVPPGSTVYITCGNL